MARPRPPSKAWRGGSVLKNMPYSVYILLNKSRTRTYTGVAADVNERLKRHNDGHVPASRPYQPYEIIYAKACPTLKEARQRERFYKSTTGRRRIREIIGSWAGKQVKKQKYPHFGPDNLTCARSSEG